MAAVVIGVDPHKLSVTIEVLDGREKVLGGGRFGTDRDGYRQMLAAGRRWPPCKVRRLPGQAGCNRPAARVWQAEQDDVFQVSSPLLVRERSGRG